MDNVLVENIIHKLEYENESMRTYIIEMAKKYKQLESEKESLEKTLKSQKFVWFNHSTGRFSDSFQFSDEDRVWYIGYANSINGAAETEKYSLIRYDVLTDKDFEFVIPMRIA